MVYAYSFKDEVAMIKDYRSEGTSIREFSRDYGVPRSTLQDILKRHGIPPNPTKYRNGEDAVKMFPTVKKVDIPTSKPKAIVFPSDTKLGLLKTYDALVTEVENMQDQTSNLLELLDDLSEHIEKLYDK